MSSFIERFAILGTAGVLGLMVILGVVGFVSFLGAEPEESLPDVASGEVEEAPFSDRPADPVRAEAVRPEASPPAQPGEAPPAGPTPRATPRPPVAPARQAAVLAEARPAGAGGASPAATPAPAPTAVATPAPAPDAAPPSTPVPPEPTPQPTPAPPPAQCPPAGSAPQLDWQNKRVRFSHGTVISFTGQPGALVVDVGGTRLSLLITSETEVRGQLSAATVVSGQGRSTEGGIVGQWVEVVC